MSRFMKLVSLISLASAASAAAIFRRDAAPAVISPAAAAAAASKLPARSTLSKRGVQDDYTETFTGTGTGPSDRDASIQGINYITFTVIQSATYDVDACLEFCNGVQNCGFANLYYEYNTDPSGPLLKCALYSTNQDVSLKQNFGGQQLLPPPAGTTYVQQSSGWLAKAYSPPTLDGYELVFGPVNGANNAPGYMGYAALDSYDPEACAQQCNTRGADAVGGACQFFNIWRGVTNGSPTGYTCSMYFQVADVSTAVNYGQGDLKVTWSLGYRRISLLPDGGFEGFNECGDFCFDTQDTNWIGTSAPGGTLDATIFFFQPYAHSGNAVALLGSATGEDANPGTLAPAQPLNTVAGKQYVITFFQNSSFSGSTLEASASITVQWNGVAAQTFAVGYEGWTFYQVTVTAVGNDLLAFVGGNAPAWSFIDDVSVYAL
ncbi:hypothetical protein BDN72DRAFT_500502 [Pluteus cervinus]|uniref:Uncharacterized protein n=1 Tax=Pluteus cervinus TaxID=181527 RepID=A0ACD3AZS7_9AGAR|nr:hypothetical protein BDN72DRAFT_500502 [Pluteus cervinus]